MPYKVTLILGDGTGPELSEVAQRVLEATGIPIEWDVQIAGETAVAQYGTPLPQQVLDSIRKTKVALKGPITTPIGSGFRSVNVALRHELDLYACVRPTRLYKGVVSRYDFIDLVIVRENSEDLYAGVEFAPGSPEAVQVESWGKGKVKPGSAVSIKHISPAASRRIARFAFEYAVRHGRKKVTAITKANIMKLTDGLFFQCARDVAADYKGTVEYEEKLVDNMCMQLVLKPELYDVLVLPNLYGDILSDQCAGLVGGLGVAPGANYGDGIALFEAVHGSAPRYKGLNKVNPTAMILSGKMMLEHLGEEAAARRLEAAVADVIREGVCVTYDLKGGAGTKEMGNAIIQKLQRSAAASRS